MFKGFHPLCRAVSTLYSGLLSLAAMFTLKGAAHESQMRKLRRDNVGLNIKDGLAAQSIIAAPLYQEDHVLSSPSLGDKFCRL